MLHLSILKTKFKFKFKVNLNLVLRNNTATLQKGYKPKISVPTILATARVSKYILTNNRLKTRQLKMPSGEKTLNISVYRCQRQIDKFKVE